MNMADPSTNAFRTLLILLGWAAFGVLSYRVATSEAVQSVLYNPFELLGIDEVSSVPPNPLRQARLTFNCSCDLVTDGQGDQAGVQEALAQVVSPSSPSTALL
jgi:hypothetical protein